MLPTLKFPLNRKLALVLAVASMWLLGGLGTYLVDISDHWFFIALDGYDFTTLSQIGLYYFTCASAQLPALVIAAWLIAMSDFRHPVRIALYVTLAVHGLLFAVRAFMWRWSIVPGLNQSIPILAGFAYIAYAVASTVLLTWLFTKPLARFFRL